MNNFLLKRYCFLTIFNYGKNSLHARRKLSRMTPALSPPSMKFANVARYFARFASLRFQLFTVHGGNKIRQTLHFFFFSGCLNTHLGSKPLPQLNFTSPLGGGDGGGGRESLKTYGRAKLFGSEGSPAFEFRGRRLHFQPSVKVRASAELIRERVKRNSIICSINPEENVDTYFHNYAPSKR